MNAEGATPADSGARVRLFARARPAWNRGRLLKWVRRLHMYLGLLLTPWVLLYGVSGALFNHPQIGRAIEQRTLDGEATRRITGFAGFSAQAIAEELVAALNAKQVGSFAIDAQLEPAFVGWPLFATKPTASGRDVVIANLDTAAVIISRHPASPEPQAPSFAEQPIELPRYQVAALAAPLGKLLAHGTSEPPVLKPHPEVAPELRLRIKDERGVAWNVSWHMGTGALSARTAEEPLAQPFVELLEALHTSHHYPVHSGIATLWALMADLTGLALVLWACTGLVMWWQMKPTRALGVLALSLALGAAALIMTGMANELRFVPPEREGGP